MKELILQGYELLTVLLPFVIVFILLSQIYKCKKTKKVKGHFFIIFIFSVYIFAVFYYTGAATIQRFGIQLNTGQINLLPFSKDIDVVAYIENILLFIPFGYMLPFIWTNTYKLKHTVLSGLPFRY